MPSTALQRRNRTVAILPDPILGDPERSCPSVGQSDTQETNR